MSVYNTFRKLLLKVSILLLFIISLSLSLHLNTKVLVDLVHRLMGKTFASNVYHRKPYCNQISNYRNIVLLTMTERKISSKSGIRKCAHFYDT